MRKMECHRGAGTHPESTQEPNVRTKTIQTVSCLPLIGDFWLWYKLINHMLFWAVKKEMINKMNKI